MNTQDLSVKRKTVELAKVRAARQELELKVDELQHEIDTLTDIRKLEIKRLEDHIKVQLDKELELEAVIKGR